MGAYIDSTRRPVEFLVKRFVDSYEMWADDQENFRLINLDNDTASIWTAYNGIATLDDKIVLSKFWQSVLPTESLIAWQRLNSL